MITISTWIIPWRFYLFLLRQSIPRLDWSVFYPAWFVGTIEQVCCREPGWRSTKRSLSVTCHNSKDVWKLQSCLPLGEERLLLVVNSATIVSPGPQNFWNYLVLPNCNWLMFLICFFRCGDQIRYAYWR